MTMSQCSKSHPSSKIVSFGGRLLQFGDGSFKDDVVGRVEKHRRSIACGGWRSAERVVIGRRRRSGEDRARRERGKEAEVVEKERGKRGDKYEREGLGMRAARAKKDVAISSLCKDKTLESLVRREKTEKICKQKKPHKNPK